jgi:polyphosphate kinase
MNQNQKPQVENKDGVKLFIQNRDLSWIDFNHRVLEEANDPTVPVFERLKYISIYSNNLNEFFMIRMGSLLDVIANNQDATDIRTHLPLKDMIKQIYKKVDAVNQVRDEIYDKVIKDLANDGITITQYKECNEEEKSSMDAFYHDQILPLLSPQIMDENHPFPHLNNHLLYIGLRLRKRGKDFFGLIPIPEGLPTYLKFYSTNQLKIVLVEDIVLGYAKEIFSAYDIEEKVTFMVSRNADLNWDEKADAVNDVRAKVKKLLQTRNRRNVLRLETQKEISSTLRDYFLEKLSLSKYQHFEVKTPLKLQFVFELEKELNPQQKDKLLFPLLAQGLPQRYQPNQPMFDQIEKQDMLLMYPYEKMTPFLTLLKEAANNPDVLAIKITVYRLGKTAKLIEYLSLAAENGKDVLVVIELRARFDEKNNIDWSERLEQAGCRIIYGLDYLKIHSKLCVITYRGKKGIQYITQVGTGNYNEKTVDQYTDISVITANSKIGIEAITFFQTITMNATSETYQSLLVSPFHLKKHFLSLIEEERKKGPEGLLMFKMNALTDNDFSYALKDASQAGVRIELNIRGICCLIPGVKGLTENIEVHSIVGRFLEHGRIYIFGQGESQKVYIASADLMTRNTERRMEVALPILDPELKRTLVNYVKAHMQDNVKGRRLTPELTYQKIPLKKDGFKLNIQEALMNEQVRAQLKAEIMPTPSKE